MSTASLFEPVLTGGIADPHFFNGRVLTAEDLSDLQSASALKRNQRGRAIGSGVVEGLEVAPADGVPAGQPVVRVRRGLAINRAGEAIELAGDVDLALTRSTAHVSASPGGFVECVRIAPPASLTNPGLYILTIAPASGLSGRAEKVENDSTGIAKSCASRYEVSGARFNAVPFEISAAATNTLESEMATLAATVLMLLEQVRTLSGAAKANVQSQLDRQLSRFRSGVAHLCLGTPRLAAFVRDVFSRDADGDSTFQARGAADALMASGQLSRDEVPLALLLLTGQGLQFVDLWSMRRRPIPLVPSPRWPLPEGARAMAEAEAAFLQFQEQVGALTRTLSQPGLQAVRANQFFRFLPPCGFLPVTGNGSARGFSLQQFFAGLNVSGSTTIDGARLGHLLHESWLYPPVDLSSPASFMVYTTRQNELAVTTASPGQRYVVFLSRTMQRIYERDQLATVLQATWNAYAGLVRRRVFLSVPEQVLKAAVVSSADVEAGRLSILTEMQAVMMVASQKAAIAAAGALDLGAALAVLSELAAAQETLARLLGSPIPGTGDPEERQAFAIVLLQYLRKQVPVNAPGLVPAIQSGNLNDAIHAQTEINSLIGSGTGQPAALGFIEVIYQSSPDGDALVPDNADPYHFVFAVGNRTNQTLDIALSGSVLAQSGDWEGAVALENADGVAIGSVRVPDQQTELVTAVVKVPANATIGEPASIVVSAAVGAPHNKTNQGAHPVRIASVGGEPVVRTVVFEAVQRPAGVDLDDVPPSALAPVQLQFTFRLRYTAAEPPDVANFAFRVSAANSPHLADWVLEFANVVTTQPAATVWERPPLSLTSGASASTPVVLRVRTPVARHGTDDKTLTLTARIESTDLPEQIFANSEPITLRLRRNQA